MSRLGGLKRNIVWNVGGYGASILIAFVLTPVVIRSLGDSRYGVWALVAQITGYYGLLDLGILGAVTHYTARHLGRNDPDGLRSSLATGFWILATLGAIVLVAGLVLTFLFPHIFRLEGVSVEEVRIAMLIVSVVVALNFPMTTFSGALVGFERIDAINKIEFLARGGGAVATYLVMTHGGGLVALAVVQAAVHVVRWTATVWTLRRVAGGFSVARTWFRRGAVKDLMGYGGRSLVINLSVLVIYNTDFVVIGAALGASAVTVYKIGQMLVAYLGGGSSAITYTFTPRLTNIAAQGDHEELERVYLLGARTAASVVAPLAGCLLAFGPSFIALWVSDKYVTGPLTQRSDVIMYLLVAASLPQMLQSISWQLLFATRKQGFLARMGVGEAVANLVLSLVLVRHLGLFGVALGTLIPISVTHLILLPRYVSATFGITPLAFVRRGIGAPLAVGAILFGIGFVLTRTVPPATWGTFLWQAALTASTGAALLYTLVLNATGRNRVRQIFQKAVAALSGRREQ